MEKRGKGRNPHQTTYPTLDEDKGRYHMHLIWDLIIKKEKDKTRDLMIGGEENLRLAGKPEIHPLSLLKKASQMVDGTYLSINDTV